MVIHSLEPRFSDPWAVAKKRHLSACPHAWSLAHSLAFPLIQEAPLLAFLPDPTPTPNTQHLKQSWAAWAHSCWLNYLQLAECLTSSDTKGPADRAGGCLHHSAVVSSQPSAGQALSLSTSPHVLPSGVGLVPSPGLSALDWCVSCLCSTPQQLEFSPPPL